MKNVLYINFQAMKRGKFACDFLDKFTSYFKDNYGGTKQEIMSRYMIFGFLQDESVAPVFKKFYDLYFSDSASAGADAGVDIEREKNYIDSVMNILNRK